MSRPPRLAARVVRWCAARLSWGETAFGDLAEEHADLAARRGALFSDLWYWGQTLLLSAAATRRLGSESLEVARTFFFPGDRPMTALLNEIRVAGRALRRYPLVTAAIVLTLALGLGVNAAAFSMLDALVLRPFSLPEVDRLAVVSEWSEDNSSPHDPDESVAPANFVDWRSQTQVFEHLAAFAWWQVNFSGGDEPERVLGFRVSADFFPMLKLTPSLGRFIGEADTTGGPHRVVVIGYGLWQRRFGARQDIVGQTVKIDGQYYDVIGVAPERFDFPTGAAVWGPLDAGPAALQDRRNRFLTVLGRLAAGRTLDDARAEMKVIGDRVRKEHPVDNERFSPHVLSFTTGMIDPGMEQILGMIQIGALLVLVIGGANIANLLLARGWDRRREIALRLAIGAGRARLLRQLLVESAVLAALAVPVSLTFAWGSLRLLKSTMPARILPFVPGWADIGIDGRLMLVISVTALLASVLFSIVPALQASKPNVVTTLREGGRNVAGGRSGRVVRSALVVGQMAVAVPLLVATGFTGSAAREFALGPQGYDPEGVITMRTVLVDATHHEAADRRRFAEQLIDGASRLPGVEAAATTTFVPSGDSNSTRELVVDGRPDEGSGRRPTAAYRAVSSRYFETMRIPLSEGRAFETTDTGDTQPVAVVSQALAHRLWPGEHAVGRRLRIGDADDKRWITVVGVAGNIIDDWFSRRNGPMLYIPMPQRPSYIVNLVVRAGGDPTALSGEVRQLLKSIDPSQPPVYVMTMKGMLHERTVGLQMIGAMMGVLGALAVVLAAIGLYSLMAYHVSQRRHEIGVRMALGASRATVIRQTIRRAWWLACVGVVIGLVPAWLLTGVLRGVLFNVVSVRPELFGAIVVALIGIAVVASLVPARQASRVDPAVALRSE
ncbi:MAG TPA: ABC transporter permease [Vicinamibacterales bacterium]|nr:ABC transporter permease [Vicinamibacterales bacterium]